MALTPTLRRLAGTAAIGLAGGLPLTAAAQDARPLTISAGIDIRHDSNVARGSASRAAVRGLTRSDEIASPSLQVDLLKPLGRNQLTLNGTVAYDFYRRNEFLNRERIGVSASGLLQAGPCAVTLSPAFSRGQSDLGEIAVPQTGGREAVRNVQTSQTYAANVECGGAIGLRPFAGIERSIADNTSAFRRLSDNRRTNYSGGIGYAQPVLGKVQIVLGQDDVDYPNRQLTGGGEDGYRTRQAGIRFEREIGANLQGIVQVNYLSLDPRRPDVTGFKGATYTASLLATLADRLQLEATLSRAAQPALQSDAAYRIARTWDLSATYAVSSLLSVSAAATFGSRRYEGERGTFGPLLGNDKRNSYVARANYALSERLKLAVDVRYTARDATDPFYDYKSLSEGISIRFVY